MSCSMRPPRRDSTRSGRPPDYPGLSDWRGRAVTAPSPWAFRRETPRRVISGVDRVRVVESAGWPRIPTAVCRHCRASLRWQSPARRRITGSTNRLFLPVRAQESRATGPALRSGPARPQDPRRRVSPRAPDQGPGVCPAPRRGPQGDREDQGATRRDRRQKG